MTRHTLTSDTTSSAWDWLLATETGHNALTLAICFLAPWVLFA